MSGNPAPAAGANGEHTPAGNVPPTGQQPPATLDLSKPLEAQVEEWKSRFGGLQRSHSALQTEHLNAQGTIQTLKDQITTITGEKESIELLNDRLEKDLAGVLGTKTDLEGKLSRTQLIALEFPALLSFEKDGLLPPGTGDELKTKLTAFSSKLGAQGEANQLPLGQTPPGPTPISPTHATLMSQLIAARNNGDMAAYDKVRAELTKLAPADPTLQKTEQGAAPV